MNINTVIKFIALGTGLAIARRLFIDGTRKLAKKLGIPVWKVQALIIAGVLVCVGGVWYLKEHVSKKAFEKGFEEGIKKGYEASKKCTEEAFKKGEREGSWKVIHEISSLDPLNEYIQWLDDLGVAVMDKFERFGNFSKSYNREYWGFGGEWD